MKRFVSKNRFNCNACSETVGIEQFKSVKAYVTIGMKTEKVISTVQIVFLFNGKK